MTTRGREPLGRLGRLACHMALVAGVLSVSSAAAGDGHRSAASIGITTDASLIVVGRVIGLVDTKPAAAERKHLEAHWVTVERTLKGSDEAGERFFVRPNGQSWVDGQAYVLALSWIEDNRADALPQPVVPASEAAIEATRAAVATGGGGVLPRRVLWMRYSEGWQGEPTTEFIAYANGDFSWTTRAGGASASGATVLDGTLPVAATADLIRRIATAPDGELADDLGSVTFRWLAPDGTTHFRRFAAPNAPLIAALREVVEALARAHGS